MSREQHVGIGIAGAGFLAETRARCYRAAAGVRAEIVAVAARTRASAEDYAARHGVATATDDYRELLADPRVTVVDLCVPNHLHRPMAEAAARASKHVVCTKPMAAYVGQDLAADAPDEELAGRDRRVMLEVAEGDARAMVEAARAAGVQLYYGENWVYAPSVVRARGLLEAAGGRILEMRGWECHSGSHSPYAKLWRATGGGALLRLGAHPLGAMIHLKAEEGRARLGRPIRPVAVSAEVADLSRVAPADGPPVHVATGWRDVENWGCAIVQFEDGSRGVAYGSDNVLGGMESRLEVYASNCHLKCNLSPGDLLRAYAPPQPGGEVFGEEYLMEKLEGRSGWSTPMPSEDWSSGQLAMVQEFAAAAAAGRPSASDGELGLWVTRVVYAAYAAAAEGRRVALE